jgi:hypothetical protein
VKNVGAFLAAAVLFVPQTVVAAQLYDPDFLPKVVAPRYEADTGPIVAIDEAHANFHTIDGRYRPFADLLAADGYQPKANAEPFSAATLAEMDILVISNALHPSNHQNWRLPTPSAFTKAEISAVEAWVKSGGKLLLIADHMPFPGAAADLAAVFGFGFLNGYAVNTANSKTRFVFRTGHGLVQIPNQESGTIKQFVTRVGQAFTVPDDAVSILTLGDLHAVLLPRESGRFPPGTPFVDASGLSQGAVVEVGEGRVAAFGEAGAFSAQISDKGGRIGMNDPEAYGNATFVLALMAWLSG